MNASSKEDRDGWIDAIRKATPVSPHLNRKENKASSGGSEKPTQPSADQQKSSSVSDKSSSKDKELAPPSYTMRQDTACDAALAAASCTDNDEEQKAIEEVSACVRACVCV